MAEQPGLIESIFKARMLGYKHRGPISFVPIWLFALVIAPSILIYAFIDTSAAKTTDAIAISILSSMIVIYGFFGAATVAALTQINEIATRFPFSDFLKEMEVFEIYTALPNYVFIVQVLSIVICCAFVLFINLIGDDINLYSIAISSGLTVYCCKMTIDLLNVIRGLSYHYAEYQKIMHEEINGVDQ